MVGRIEGIGKIVEETDGILNGFELVGQDGVWHPAQARTRGPVVMVKSSLVKQPLAVRYACHPEAQKDRPWNLYNKAAYLPRRSARLEQMPYDPAKTRCLRNLNKYEKDSQLVILTAFVLLVVCLSPSSTADPRPGSPLFRFGAVADCQYCDKTSGKESTTYPPKSYPPAWSITTSWIFPS